MEARPPYYMKGKAEMYVTRLPHGTSCNKVSLLYLLGTYSLEGRS